MRPATGLPRWIPFAWLAALAIPAAFVTRSPCELGLCTAHAGHAPQAATAPAAAHRPQDMKEADADKPAANGREPSTKPATQPATAPADRKPPFDKLPTGELIADKMDLYMPPGLRELTLKLQQILSQRQGWWNEYSKLYARQGQPAPYHPNMGISPEEYERILQLTDQIRFDKVSDVAISITRGDDGMFNFATLDGNLLDITGVGVNLEKRVLRTPVGEVKDGVILLAGEDDQSRNLGPWEGFRWRKQESVDAGNSTFLQFDLGRLVKEDKLYISMRSNKIEHGNVTFKANFTITVPRKQP